MERTMLQRIMDGNCDTHSKNHQTHTPNTGNTIHNLHHLSLSLFREVTTVSKYPSSNPGASVFQVLFPPMHSPPQLFGQSTNNTRARMLMDVFLRSTQISPPPLHHMRALIGTPSSPATCPAKVQATSRKTSVQPLSGLRFCPTSELSSNNFSSPSYQTKTGNPKHAFTQMNPLSRSTTSTNMSCTIRPPCKPQSSSTPTLPDHHTK